MKKNLLWMLTVILTFGLSVISCTSEEDNSVVSEEPQYPANFDVFATLKGNAGDLAVVAALKTLENVEEQPVQPTEQKVYTMTLQVTK